MDEWMLLKEIGRVGSSLLLEINPYGGPREKIQVGRSQASAYVSEASSFPKPFF